MSLPKRFSGVPRKKVLVTFTAKMYWDLQKASKDRTVPELIRSVLEGYLSSLEGG